MKLNEGQSARDRKGIHLFHFGDIAERTVEVRKVESKKIKVQRKKEEF